MHLEFSGVLHESLINANMPNKRAHAALVNVHLKSALDAYMANGSTTNGLMVSPVIHGLLREANGLDPVAYAEWVATVSGELVLEPKKYAEKGYTVPWEGVSQPFLIKVWQKDDHLAGSPF